MWVSTVKFDNSHRMGNVESNRKHNAVAPDSKATAYDIFYDHHAINEHLKAINRAILNTETQISFLKIMINEGLAEFKLLQEVL